MQTFQSQSHSLPIKQVTLYKNNLAFLKRAGKVSTAQLEIAESIKDLVTSTLSISSDAPVSVLFGAQKQVVDEPEYGFQYGTRSNLGAFLDSLIGARVKLDLAAADGGSASGHVLIVEQNKELLDGSEKSDKPAVYQDVYSAVHLLLDSGSCRRFTLTEVKEVTILDQELQAQLIKSLTGRVKAKTARPVAKKSDAMQLSFAVLADGPPET